MLESVFLYNIFIDEWTLSSNLWAHGLKNNVWNWDKSAEKKDEMKVFNVWNSWLWKLKRNSHAGANILYYIPTISLSSFDLVSTIIDQTVTKSVAV